MECSQAQWLSNEDYLKAFTSKTVHNRIPICGSIDITYRCNLRCVHCYLDESTRSARRNVSSELHMEQWFKVIDDVTEAGCLFLLISGGEPLMRKDFSDIYIYAKKKGLLITLFTNGTLINDDIIRLFREYPPRLVEISLYGSTKDTYEAVTGVKGSFSKCMNAIEMLLDTGVNLKLKTILMTINRHEIKDMQDMTEHYGIDFRLDGLIIPRFNGDMAPTQLRVHPKEIIDAEFSDVRRYDAWIKFYHRIWGTRFEGTVYQCGAGTTMFHIDPAGVLKPCLMADSVRYDLCRGQFADGWEREIPRIRDLKMTLANPCSKCNALFLCGYCPGLFRMETGDENLPPEYVCAMGRYRREAIEKKIEKEKTDDKGIQIESR